MPDWVFQRVGDMGLAEGHPHAKVIDFQEPFLDIPDVLEHTGDENDSYYSDESNEHPFQSDAPTYPSDQRSDVSPLTTRNNSSTYVSNGSSNADIVSVSSIVNSNVDDNDGVPSPTTDVTKDNVHDGANINSKRNDGAHSYRIGTTTNADEYQTLNANDDEHASE